MPEGGERPRIAVVGCGRWGRNHVRNYAELGALAGVVDNYPERAAGQAAAYAVPALTFEQALADPAIDGLVFALPPSQNLPLGLRALQGGKHLFVEKPLALSAADGERLCGEAEALDRRLMVGHVLQYHPAFRALAETVREGRLGRILSLVSSRLDLGRIRREEDALWALAPHDLSMIFALAGATPLTVTAQGGWHTHRTIADSAGVELGFSDGSRAEIRVSWLHPYKEQRLVAIGTAAMAVFDDREPWETKLVLHRYGVEEGANGVSVRRDAPEPVRLDAAEPLREECRHFLASIASGERPLTDGREGVRVLEALERAGAALAASRSPGGAASP